MVTIVSALWILFDVLICLRTGHMTEPFPRWEWWTWLISGIFLALFAVGAEWLNRRKQTRERIEDKEEINAKFEDLKANIAAISQKPEPPEQKIQEINQRMQEWSLPTSEAQIRHQRQMERNQAMGRRRMRLFASAGALVDAQKRSSKDDDPKNGNSN